MSDDYEFDDLILDDEALAALDHTEQSYMALRQPEPPTKKRKISPNTWTSGVGSLHLNNSIVQDDDLPDISVNIDGSYSLQTQQQPTRKAPNSRPHPQPEFTPSTSSLPGGTSIPQPPPKHINRTHNAISSSRPQPRQSNSNSHSFLPPPNRSSQFLPDPPTVQPQFPQAGPSSRPIGDWQLKCEELTKDYQRLIDSLKEATNIKYARDGELAIMRKNMDKSIKNYETQIAALRQANEEADARQRSTQKEMRDEIERVKTQFIFKQHEIEASARKAPSTSRVKRNLREPVTPLPSSQRNFPMVPSSSVPPNRMIQDTPMKPPPLPKFKSPKRATSRSPEKKFLPGFTNSFATSTPVRPASSQASKLVKEKEDADFWNDTASIAPLRTASQVEGLRATILPLPDQGHDFPMDDIPLFPPSAPDPELDNEPVEEEEFDDPFPLNWQNELSRLILHHTIQFEDTPTLQILLKVNETVLKDARSLYSEACTQILECISANTDEYTKAARVVCASFITVLNCLNMSQLILELKPLLHLLTVLTFSLPEFSSILLSIPHPEHDGSQLVATFTDLILTQISPDKISENEELGVHILDLFQNLSWCSTEDSINRLATIAKRGDVLATLLNSALPCAFICRVVRCLMVLATSSPIARVLLSPPLPEQQTPSKLGDDPTMLRIPHIENLSNLLVDFTKDAQEHTQLKIDIVSFFAILATRDQIGPEILNRSPTLLPALVLFITQITNPLWEGDEDGIKGPLNVSQTIETIHQTISLLHYLAIHASNSQNFRHRLQSAPHRLFNGIIHMFTITFGRLSYAEASDWVGMGETFMAELEVVKGIAQDLLELIVVGPDLEEVWNAFHFEAASSDDDDEDKMEAELLGRE